MIAVGTATTKLAHIESLKTKETFGKLWEMKRKACTASLCAIFLPTKDSLFAVIEFL